ncbi:MAG: Trk system potassium transporter TrkA [Oscillospiraceae bacterium]|nr:Trk system potassium transporter TrkA [Oscillospiraceae bacterium]
MTIIIVGIGKVGYTLAENLVADGHDVTLVDNDPAALGYADDSLDVLCVKGNGGSMDVLRSAGASTADVVIAATDRDELNILCCLISKKMGTKYTVARIRDYDYALELSRLKADLDIDMVINPEHATATQISRLLRFSAAADIETFYRGRIELVGFKVQEGDIVAGEPLYMVKKKLHNIPVLFFAVNSGSVTSIPNGATVLSPGDKAYVIGEQHGINMFFKTLGRVGGKTKRVTIVGGGRITLYLARYLSKMNIDVKIVESDEQRCRELCEALPEALIVNGDGTDQDLLASENIEKSDAFAALTGKDEDNLITALYAKRCGIPKTIAKINRQNYYSIIDQLGIDSIVSPKQITAYFMLQNIRGIDSSKGSRMEELYQIAGGGASAMVFTVAGNTKHLGEPLKSIRFYDGILVALIYRDGAFIIPEGNDYIKENDGLTVVTAGKPLGELNDIFRE